MANTDTAPASVTAVPIAERRKLHRRLVHGGRRGADRNWLDLGATGAIALSVIPASVLLVSNWVLPNVELDAFKLGLAFAATSALSIVCAWRIARERMKLLHERTEKLETSTARYQGLVEAQGDFIIRRSPDGTVTFANQNIAKALETTPENLRGEELRLTVLDGAPAPHAAELLPPPHRVKYEQLVELDQSHRWLLWEDFGLVDPDTGHIVEVQSSGRDVTELKTAIESIREAKQAAEAANQSKSGFLATMSHEIRTPMNGVLGMAGLLRDTKLTAEQKSYVKAIADSGKGLLTLIDDILDLSKIEAGKMDVTRQAFDLPGVVEGVCELLAPKAAEKSLDLTCFIDPRLQDQATGDGARLRQVLLNLVGNAIKFTEDGSVSVEVLLDGDGSKAEFQIADTGIGLTSEQRDRVFDAFTQAEDGHDRTHGGTGLGLTISRKLVHMMGGELEVQSVSGEGSVFSFHLDLQNATSKQHPEAHPLSGKSYLIAGPGGADCKSIARYIEAWGGEIATADDARAVETELRSNAYDGLVGSPELADALDSSSGLPEISLVVLPPAKRGRSERYARAGFSRHLVCPVRRLTLLRELSPELEYPDAEPASDQEIAPAKAVRPPLEIMLVEDNPLNAMLAMKVLEKSGHTATRFENGEEAVAHMKQSLKTGETGPPDAILMDVQMPVMDGLKASRAIRELESGSNRVPIVALTANAMPEDRQACHAAGMDDYLAKPFDAAHLADVLHRVTSTR